MWPHQGVQHAQEPTQGKGCSGSECAMRGERGEALLGPHLGLRAVFTLWWPRYHYQTCSAWSTTGLHPIWVRPLPCQPWCHLPPLLAPCTLWCSPTRMGALGKGEQVRWKCDTVRNQLPDHPIRHPLGAGHWGCRGKYLWCQQRVKECLGHLEFHG